MFEPKWRGFWLAAMALALFVLWPGTRAEAATRCADTSGLSYTAPMRFCMRNDIYVAAVGEITASTPDEFTAFLARVRAAGYTPHSVTFHSPGGNMLAGMKMGATTRDLKLDTHVGERSRCASACMLAFIGGWSRKVTHDGRIGNHQFSHAESAYAKIQSVQDMIDFLSRYHELMHVSPLAVFKAMSRRADDIYWYSPQEQREWGIVTKR